MYEVEYSPRLVAKQTAMQRRNNTPRAGLDLKLARRRYALSKVNEARHKHGLRILAITDKVRSRDGICIRCGAEQVMNSEGRHICALCRSRTHNRRVRNEQEALRKMDAKRLVTAKSELKVRLESTLHNLNLVGRVRRNRTTILGR